VLVLVLVLALALMSSSSAGADLGLSEEQIYGVPFGNSPRPSQVPHTQPPQPEEHLAFPAA